MQIEKEKTSPTMLRHSGLGSHLYARPTVELPRVGIVSDLLEEKWVSMDITSDLLLHHLRSEWSDTFGAEQLRPPMRRRFSAVQGAQGRGFTVDRVLNRFWDYPRMLRQVRDKFDVFHIVDHSYSQLVHALPPERTVVTCHDLYTFRSILEPEKERRSKLFRMMTKRILSGLQKAAWITCDSAGTRNELLAYDLVPPERTVVVYLGIYPGCTPDADPVVEAEATRILSPPGDEVLEILHVGSSVDRKRIDVLLRVFNNIRKVYPTARLTRIGGEFTPSQQALVDELGLNGSVAVRAHVDRSILPAFYRRAAIVLQPSDMEGFGLPVAEALACGTPVVVSDIPVLREVGGVAASYGTVGDVEGWTEVVLQLLEERACDHAGWNARREAGIAHAAQFSWSNYTRQSVDLYRRVLERV